MHPDKKGLLLGFLAGEGPPELVDPTRPLRRMLLLAIATIPPPFLDFAG